MDYNAIVALRSAEWKALQQFSAPYVAAIRAIVRAEFEPPPEMEDRLVQSYCTMLLGTVRSSDVQEAAWNDMWKIPGKIVTNETTWAVANKLYSAKNEHMTNQPPRPTHIPWKWVP